MIKFAKKSTERKVFSMNKSIQHFEEFGIRKLEKVIENFLKDPKDMAALVHGIQDGVIELGLDIIKETLEDCDRMLRESAKRKSGWVISRRDKKQLVTSLGEICFCKTLFKSKEDGHSEYLLDTILGMDPHERMTEDAEAELLKEVADTSYQKAGTECSIQSSVSKQTVKNKIHALDFNRAPKPCVHKKRQVKYLYIDADEDHVALQFRNTKGDLQVNEWGYKSNCAIAKLIYVYEGIEKEHPKSSRHYLVNTYYFSGIYAGEAGNAALWDEVYHYLEETYDLDYVEKIFLNGDGGNWIKAGKKRISGITYVLDGFHLQQYLIRATSHLLDSAEDARRELTEAMKAGTKEDLKSIFARIYNVTETEAGIKRVQRSETYFLENWMAIKTRLNWRRMAKGCSAEGHVSHVLSARMSSRPMGWSITGADKMAHLRAYKWNGGDMLELVRAQRKAELPKAVGAENEVISATEMLSYERKSYSELGKYVTSISHHLSLDSKKKVWFQSQIWGL